MARETWVQSQVESYQRLKKWYLMPPCLTLSIIRYGSRVKWSNLWKWVAPSPATRCSSYRKGNHRVTLDYGRQLYLLTSFTRSCSPQPNTNISLTRMLCRMRHSTLNTSACKCLKHKKSLLLLRFYTKEIILGHIFGKESYPSARDKEHILNFADRVTVWLEQE